MMPMTLQTEKMTRLGNLLSGLGALASLWPTSGAPMRYPHRSEADALRGDGFRIGDDLREVIERERARAEAEAN